MKTTAELADFERVEPRCRVCRDPNVRTVWSMLSWTGAVSRSFVLWHLSLLADTSSQYGDFPPGGRLT